MVVTDHPPAKVTAPSSQDGISHVTHRHAKSQPPPPQGGMSKYHSPHPHDGLSHVTHHHDIVAQAYGTCAEAATVVPEQLLGGEQGRWQHVARPHAAALRHEGRHVVAHLHGNPTPVSGRNVPFFSLVRRGRTSRGNSAAGIRARIPDGQPSGGVAVQRQKSCRLQALLLSRSCTLLVSSPRWLASSSLGVIRGGVTNAPHLLTGGQHDGVAQAQLLER